MSNREKLKYNKRIFPFLILLLLIAAGCSHMQTGRHGAESPGFVVKRIAFAGFKSAAYEGNKANDELVSMPSGRSQHDPALIGKSLYLTSKMFDAMTEYEGYELVSPEISGEAFSGIDASGQGVDNIEIAGMAARELQADAAIIGLLYRWKEREGSDYAVKSPASVFFDICLVNPDGGSILWRGRFNKTQKSLSENLLDIRTFFKGKGKWMTADDLAEMGLRDIIDDLSLFIEKGKEVEN